MSRRYLTYIAGVRNHIAKIYGKIERQERLKLAWLDFLKRNCSVGATKTK